MSDRLATDRIPFNITSAVFCPMDATGTYTGTPVTLKYGKSLTLTPQADALDPLKAYGKVVELATVVTHAEWSIEQAGIDMDVYTVIASMQFESGGVNPNDYEVGTVVAGGEGLPYFGMICSAAALNGSNYLVGLPKNKLSNVPEMSLNENDWTMGDMEALSIVNVGSVLFPDRPFLIRTNRTSTPITLTAAFFNTFFGVS